MSTSLTVAEKAITIRDWLQDPKRKGQISDALPQWLDAARFLRVCFSSIMRNPRLVECTPESILSCVMQCAQLGLEPILGRAHLVPFWNSKKKSYECQLQMGYQGLIELAERTEKFSGISAHCVHEKDHFEIDYGTNQSISHKPYIKGDRGKILGAYTVWTRKDGRQNFSFLSIADIYRKFRSRSQAYTNAERKGSKDSPWHTDEDEMAKKSMIKSHSKLEPASIEFQQAVELDTRTEIGLPEDPYYDLLPEDEEQPAAIMEGQGKAPEGGGGEEDFVAKFDAQVPKNIHPLEFGEYLKLCAEDEKLGSVEEFKQLIVESNQMDALVDAFMSWKDSDDIPGEPSPAEKKEQVAMPPPDEPPPLTDENAPPEPAKEKPKPPQKSLSAEIDCSVRGKKVFSTLCEKCTLNGDCKAYQAFKKRR